MSVFQKNAVVLPALFLVAAIRCVASVNDFSPYYQNVSFSVSGNSLTLSIANTPEGTVTHTVANQTVSLGPIVRHGVIAWVSDKVRFALYDSWSREWKLGEAPTITGVSVAIHTHTGLVMWREATRMGFAVYDPERAQWQISEHSKSLFETAWKNAEGVVIWEANQAVNVATYDSGNHRWATRSYSLEPDVGTSHLRVDTSRGLACWDEGQHIHHATFDPVGGNWTSLTHGPGSGMLTAGGVVTWVDGTTVKGATYDHFQEQWKTFDASNPGLSPLNLSVDTTGTITWNAGTGNHTRGYNPYSGQWTDLLSLPRSLFQLSPPAGDPPLFISFTDLSSGAVSTWFRNDSTDSRHYFRRGGYFYFTNYGLTVVTQSAGSLANRIPGFERSTQIVKTDVTPPIGSITINSNATTAFSSTVWLSINATDNSGSIASMRFSEDEQTWTDWEPFTALRQFQFSSFQGTLRIYCQLRDSATNLSTTLTDYIEGAYGVIWTPTNTISYGHALDETILNATVGGVPGTFAYTPPLGTVLPVGNHSLRVDFLPADTNAYTATNATYDITVTPASLTISVKDVFRFVGQQNPVFQIAYSGFVNGEQTNVLTSIPVVTTTATVASPVGNYELVPSGAVAANYAITYENGLLRIFSEGFDPGSGAEGPEVALYSTSVREQQPSGTIVGLLSVAHTATNASHVFLMRDGILDNDRFSVVGDTLVSSEVFNYSEKSSYRVKITAIDSAQNAIEREFTIGITPPAEVDGLTAYFSSNLVVSNATLGTLNQLGLDYFWVFRNQLKESQRIYLPPPADLPSSTATNGSTVVPLSNDEATRIFAAKLAHAIWVDENNLVPWKLSEFSESELDGLFDWIELLRSIDSPSFYAVADFNPSIGFEYAVTNGLINNSLTGSVHRVLNDVRSDFVHGAFGVDPNVAQSLQHALSHYRFSYSGNPRRSTRRGCHSMTRILLGVLRSINIPGIETTSGYFLPGHSELILPAEKLVLPHGDDVYNASLTAVPVTKLMIPFQYYSNNLSHAHCNGDPYCVAQRHRAQLATQYPSPTLLDGVRNPSRYGSSAVDFLVGWSSWDIGLTSSELDLAATNLLGNFNEARLLNVVAETNGGYVIVRGSSATFPVDSRVSIKALPKPGYRFDRWGGEILPGLESRNPAVFSLSANHTITPIFVPQSSSPIITVQPRGVSTVTGRLLSMGVTASGALPLTFQWRRDGTAIVGETNSLLTLGAVESADSGIYDIVVSNSFGTILSEPAEVIVSGSPLPPMLIQQPTDQVGGYGDDIGFGVVASGTDPKTYQWSKNGVPLPSETEATIRLIDIDSSDAAEYSVTVSNEAGTNQSRSAVLTVVPVVVSPSLTSPLLDQVTVLGNDVQFAVSVAGTPPFLFQWRFNGADMIGETNSSLSLQSVSVASAGGYSLSVSGPGGGVVSRTATLIVHTPPKIEQAPKSISLTAGATHTLGVFASGTGPLSYQWQKNGVNLAGQTGMTLTLSSVTLADVGTYQVVVTSPYGTVTSAGAVIVVNTSNTGLTWANPLAITYGSPLSATQLNASAGTVTGGYVYTPPAGTVLPAGSHQLTVQFTPHDTNTHSPASGSVTLNVNRAPLTIQADDQQRPLGQPNPPLTLNYSGFVNGEGSHVLSPAPTISTMAHLGSPVGTYPITVSGGSASNYVISRINGILRVISDLPLITRQPTNQLVQVGVSASFEVEVGGAGPFGYQWNKDGTNISWGTNRVLQLTNVMVSARGAYQVLVTNAFGSALSDPAALLFSGPPVVIIDQPDQTVGRGEDVTLRVVLSGTPPFGVRWYHYATRLPDATGPELTLTNIQPGQAGIYQLTALNSFGNTASRPITVSVVEPLTIAIGPTNRRVLRGGNLTLSAVTTGDAPLLFRWYKDHGELGGASMPLLSLTNVQRSHTGIYHATVSNVLGLVTSAPVNVQVLIPARITGPDRLADGRFRLLLGASDNVNLDANEAGRLVIEGSDDLRIWQVLLSNGSGLVLSNGQAVYEDAGAIGRARRFYRVFQP